MIGDKLLERRRLELGEAFGELRMVARVTWRVGVEVRGQSVTGERLRVVELSLQRSQRLSFQFVEFARREARFFEQLGDQPERFR